MKAITLKAFACAANIATSRNLHENLMLRAAEEILGRMDANGLWGYHPLRTSVAVQALNAYGNIRWQSKQAMEYLRAQINREADIIILYYAELALNSEKVKCLKDLPGS